MIPPVFDQVSILSDGPRPVLECDDTEDRTRQEFRDEVDVVKILKRYGPIGLPFVSAPPVSGEVDTDISLSDAYLHRFEALEAYKTAPRPVLERFPTPQAFEAALASGEAVLVDGELFVVEPDAPRSGASGSATGQAEGAAGSSAESVT